MKQTDKSRNNKRQKMTNKKQGKTALFAVLFVLVCLGAAGLQKQGTTEQDLAEEKTESTAITENNDITAMAYDPFFDNTDDFSTGDINTDDAGEDAGEAGAFEAAQIDVSVLLAEIPPYAGTPYAVIGDNVPEFGIEVDAEVSFEYYSDLDQLGRCGPAFANIGQDLMPEEERGDIGQIRPSGWHTVKYDCIADRYLYNRCHLIAFQLAGENANERNLITGTRYMNVTGMLPFEEEVGNYVRETGNHVLYRVTPIFEGENLVATGVRMEAWSLEDEGAGVCFDVFVYNCQPDIVIDYATGDSYEENPGVSLAQGDADGGESEISSSEDTVSENALTQTPTPIITEVPTPVITEAPTPVITEAPAPVITENPTPAITEAPNTDGSADYIANTNTGKFHYPWCSSVGEMAEHNKWYFYGSRDELISLGYVPCKRCNP